MMMPEDAGNDIVEFYAKNLTPARASVVAQVLSLFLGDVRSYPGKVVEEDEVLSNLDNQMHWFWVNEKNGEAIDLASFERAVGEPGYDSGRWPSIERIVRFMISRPIGEVRAFLRKERKVSDAYRGKKAMRGGSNTNRAVAAFAEALGRGPQVALVRRLLADACRRRGSDGATYPFVVTSLAALCAEEFDLRGDKGRRKAFNPNPQLTAVDVEHLIVFLCGRSVPELERLLARARSATDDQVARDRKFQRQMARLRAAAKDQKEDRTRQRSRRAPRPSSRALVPAP